MTATMYNTSSIKRVQSCVQPCALRTLAFTRHFCFCIQRYKYILWFLFPYRRFNYCKAKHLKQQQIQGLILLNLISVTLNHCLSATMDRRRVIYCAVFLMLNLTYSHVSARQNDLTENSIIQNAHLLPIIFGTSEYLPANWCKEDTQKFFMELVNGTAWAVKSKFMQIKAFLANLYTKRKPCL